MQSIKKILFIISIVFFPKLLTAQVVVMGDSTKLNQLILNECNKSDTFEVFIRVASGTLGGTIVLSDTFLNNYVFTGIVPNAIVTASSGIGTNIAILTLDSSILNAALTGVRIKFLIRAKCGANGLSSATHSMFLTAASFSLLKKSNDYVSANKAATLILEARNIVNKPNALLATSYTRNWRIRNTGTNSQIDSVWFRVIYQPGTSFTGLLVNGSAVSPTTQIGDTMWYRIVQTLRNQSVFNADTVFISETYLVNTCPPNSSSSRVSAYWGCFDSKICNEFFITPSTSVPPTTPSMQYLGGYWFTGTSTANIKGGKFSTCAGNKVTFYSLAKNNSSIQASNVKINMTSASNWEFPTQYDLTSWLATANRGRANNAIDTSSIRYKIGNNGAWKKIPNTAFLKTDTGNTNNGSVSCGKPSGWANITFVQVGVPGYINPGDSVIIEWQQYTKCCTDCTPYHLNEGSVRFDYSNACGTANFYTDAQRLTWENHGNSFSPLPPNYFASGTNGYVKGLFYWGDNLDPDGDAPLGAYSDDSMRFELTLPTGFVFDNNINDALIYNIGINSSSKPGSVSYIGNILKLTYARRNLPVTTSAQYEFWIRLRLDCSVPGAVSGPVSITVNAFRIENDCSCVMQSICSNLLAESGCPDLCPSGGASMTTFSNNRKNLGLPDLNNDGWPNGTTYDPNFVKMRTFTWLDTMDVKMKGRIDTAGGNVNFKYVYFEQTFNQNVNTNASSHVWKFISALATVYDVSTGNSYTGSVSPSQVGVTTDQVRYDLSSVVPLGFNYEQSDSFKLQAFWHLNPTSKNSIQVPSATNFIVNSLYASNVNNPSVVQRFSCANISGSYETFRISVFVHGGFVANGCQWSFNFTNYFACGGYETGDYFRYEVRRFHTIDTQFLIVPSFFKPDLTRNITFNISKDAGNPDPVGNYVGTIPWSKLIIINDTLYKLPVGYLFKSGGGLAENSDDGANHQFSIPFNPNCNTPIGSFTPYHTSQYKNLNGPSWNWLPQGPQNPQPSSAFIARNQGNWNASQQGIYNFSTAPNLQLVPVNPNQQLVDDTGYWDIRVDNLSNVNPSYFTFMNFSNTSGSIVPVELRRMPANTLVPQVNGIYQLGTINQASSITYRLKAVTLNCNLDSVIAKMGQDCGGYPNNIASYTCIPKTGILKVTPLTPVVQTDFVSFPTSTVNICDTLDWVVSVSQRQLAAAFDIRLDFEAPNNGNGTVLLEQSGYKFPSTASSFSPITAKNMGSGVYRLFLSDSIALLKAKGLRPIGENPNNEILVKVRMLTNCNFVSGSSVRFISKAKKACGEELLPNTDFKSIHILGAPMSKLILGSSASGNIGPCSTPVIINFNVKNLDLASAGNTDSISVTLPEGLNYINGSENFTLNPFTQTAPVIRTENGHETLVWCCAPLLGKDSTKFTIQIQSNKQTKCNTNASIETVTTSNFNTLCGAINCNVKVQNSYEDRRLSIFKPELNFSGYNSNFVYPSFYKYKFSGNVNNASTATASLAGVTLKTYMDINNNLIYEKGIDSLVKTTVLSSGIPANGFVTFTDSFESTKYKPSPNLPMYTVIDTGDAAANCLCSGVVMSAFNQALPIDFLNLNAINLNNYTCKLNWILNSDLPIIKYTIFRMTEKEKSFSLITSVQNKKPISLNTEFLYFDTINELPNGYIYYQVEAIDQNNNTKISDIVKINKSFNFVRNDLFYLVPNPAIDFVKLIFYKNTDNINIKITDIQGREVIYTKFSGLETTLNIGNLAPGMYTLSVLSKNGTITQNLSIIR